jgi:hypothetical protein
MREQTAGKFRMRPWEGGWPLSVDLEHTELNGDTAKVRLFGVEELYDLQYVVARVIAQVEAEESRGHLNPAKSA